MSFSKKKFALVIVLCAMLFTLCGVCGCAGETNPPASNSAATENANTNADAETNTSAETPAQYTLIVGYDAGNSPYSFKNAKGEPVGIDLDLAAAVCRLKGWNLQMKAIDWEDRDTLLSSGAVSCLWSGIVVENEKTTCAFSDSYLAIDQVIVVKKGTISEESGLKDKTIATMSDSLAEAALAEKAELGTLAYGELLTVSDNDAAFAALDADSADAVACDSITAKTWMAAHPDVYATVATLSSRHYAVEFRASDADRAKEVSEALSKLTSDSTAKQLCEKYADYGVSYYAWAL